MTFSSGPTAAALDKGRMAIVATSEDPALNLYDPDGTGLDRGSGMVLCIRGRDDFDTVRWELCSPGCTDTARLEGIGRSNSGEAIVPYVMQGSPFATWCGPGSRAAPPAGGAALALPHKS